MSKLLYILLLLNLISKPYLAAQIDTKLSNPYGAIIWEAYPKPWNEYPHNVIIDSLVRIENNNRYPEVICHIVITEFHLPQDYPSIYHFRFTSPSIPSWHYDVIDTSVESYAEFSFKDFNSDGYKDLRYRVTPKVRCEFPVWLFNPKIISFQYSPEFDCLDGDTEIEDKTLSTSGYHFYFGSRSNWDKKDTVINNEIRTIEETHCTDYSATENYYTELDSSDREYHYYSYKYVNNTIQLVQHKIIYEKLRMKKWYTSEIIEKLVGTKLQKISETSKVDDDN